MCTECLQNRLEELITLHSLGTHQILYRPSPLTLVFPISVIVRLEKDITRSKFTIRAMVAKCEGYFIDLKLLGLREVVKSIKTTF